MLAKCLIGSSSGTVTLQLVTVMRSTGHEVRCFRSSALLLCLIPETEIADTRLHFPCFFVENVKTEDLLYRISVFDGNLHPAAPESVALYSS
mgnify:CR=1 FL=1